MEIKLKSAVKSFVNKNIKTNEFNHYFSILDKHFKFKKIFSSKKIFRDQIIFNWYLLIIYYLILRQFLGIHELLMYLFTILILVLKRSIMAVVWIFFCISLFSYILHRGTEANHYMSFVFIFLGLEIVKETIVTVFKKNE